MRAAADSSVLALNHGTDPARRERALREWAGGLSATPCASPIPTGDLAGSTHGWFERAAGASAWLTVLAMLALAAEPPRGGAGESEAGASTAYARWIAPAGAMLDSFSDIAEDRANGEHSYIAYYPSTQAAAARVGELVRRARGEALALPRGQRHAVLLSCMVAFYLSKDSTRAPQLLAVPARCGARVGPRWSSCCRRCACGARPTASARRRHPLVFRLRALARRAQKNIFAMAAPSGHRKQ